MRRTLKSLASVFVAAIVVLVNSATSAQSFPSKRILWIVPYTPGAGSDTVARLLSPKLSQALGGEPIVIENRGGAGGAIGTAIGAKAAPDGYTWIFGSDPPFTINPNLKPMPFDPVKDFVPVSFLSRVPLVLVVRPSLPVNNLKELIEFAKAKPGSLNGSSSGNGSSSHLALELLKSAAGINVVHVAYKGQAEALTDVIAERIDMTFSSVGTVSAHLKAGKLRAIAIGSPERFDGMLELPTVAEQGFPHFDVSAWHGLLMPAGTPPEIVTRVNQEVARALKTAEVAEKMRGMGYIPVGGPPSALEQLIKGDLEKWGKVIREAGIKAD